MTKLIGEGKGSDNYSNQLYPELYYLKGKTYSEISKMTEKNYRTVKKYIEMDDFNEQHHKAKRLK